MSCLNNTRFRATWRYGCLWGFDPTHALPEYDRLTMGGVIKYVVKEQLLGQKYPHCVPQSIQEMEHFAAYLWAYWLRAHSDAPITVGTTSTPGAGSLVSTWTFIMDLWIAWWTPPPTQCHPPTCLPLSCTPLLWSWCSWSGPAGLTLSPRVPVCPALLPPCAPRGWEVGVCPSGPRGLSEGL